MSTTFKPFTCPTCQADADTGSITTGTLTAKGDLINEEHAFCHSCGTDFFWSTGKPRKARTGNSVKGIERQIPGTFLRPVECADEAEVLEEAMANNRKRAVMAVNDEGTLVVCCARTARKHGWKIEGTFYSTSGTKPAKEDKKAVRAAKLAKIDTKDIHAASNARIGKVLAQDLADLI